MFVDPTPDRRSRRQAYASRRPGPPMPVREDLRGRVVRRKLEHLAYLVGGVVVALLALVLLSQY